MGKTTLLKYLETHRLLSSHQYHIFIDLTACFHASTANEFVFWLAGQIIDQINQHNGITQSILKPHENLLTWSNMFKQAYPDKKLLLIWDEFEKINNLIDKAKHDFNQTNLFQAMRNVIQHVPEVNFIVASQRDEDINKWVDLSGCFGTVRLSYFSNQQTEHILTKPVPHFQLHYEPAALEKIYQLTHNHPVLVQGVGFCVVNAKNQQTDPKKKYLVSEQDIDALLNTLLDTLSIVFPRFIADINRQDKQNLILLAQHSQKTNHYVIDPISLNKIDEDTLKEWQQYDFIYKKSDKVYFTIPYFRLWLLTLVD